MALKQVLEVFDLLETPTINEAEVRNFFINKGSEETEIDIQKIKERKGETNFIKIHIKGIEGQSEGGESPTIGIIGR